MNLNVPGLSLVVLVGVTGSGKSTFARTHFKPTEVISSDFCRGLVADDENDQSATPAAFELLRFIAGQRLEAGRLTVIDATNVQAEARRDLVTLAREHDVLPTAIVLDLPEDLCAERNKGRPDRDFGPHVLRLWNHFTRRWEVPILIAIWSIILISLGLGFWKLYKTSRTLTVRKPSRHAATPTEA